MRSIPAPSSNLQGHLVTTPSPSSRSSPSVPKGVASLSSLQKQKLSGLEEKDEDRGKGVDDSDDVKSPERPKNDKKSVKSSRDKGIGIYAPFHHKRAQQLYESLGFEKIAKIGNYYTTDRALF